MKYKKALDAFLMDEPDGMKEFATELNKHLIKTIWYDEKDEMNEVLEKTSRLRQIVNIKHEITKDRDYYMAFVWGIENMARKILHRDIDFSEVDEAINKYKYLDKILNYLSRKKDVQHKDLANYLDISPSQLTNLFNKKNIESLKIINRHSIGRTTWYSLTRLGTKYINVKNKAHNKEKTIFKKLMLQLLKVVDNGYEIEKFKKYIESTLFLDKEEEKDLLNSIDRKMKEYNLIKERRNKKLNNTDKIIQFEKYSSMASEKNSNNSFDYKATGAGY